MEEKQRELSDRQKKTQEEKKATKPEVSVRVM